MTYEPPDRTDAELARRRAAFGFAGLAVAAAVVVVLVFALSRPGSTHKQADVAGVSTTAPSAAPTTASTTVARPKTTAPRTTPAASKPPPTSCTPAPCVLAGDPGIIAAVNALRKSQSLPAVTAGTSAQATSCALHSGDGSSCPGSYYWAHVPATQGTAIVTKISTLSGGRAWLLNPKLTKLAVGCAQPVTGQYQCAVLDQSAA
jgi:hypothetical protein